MTSFLDLYLKTTENSQPAREYHIWSALAALSAFAGRRFWFPFGPYRYHTNIYVVLVGDPGNGKSSAMNRSKNMVRAAGVCPVAATQITKEALTLKMSSTVDGKPKKEPFAGQRFFEHDGRKYEYNQYAIFATELVEFIAVNPQGFLDFLTAVWDEPIIEVETKNKGQDYVVGPYITMLACMTPEKLKGYMKLSILTGGFARRTAFMFCNYKNIVHWPSYTDEQKAAEAACIEFGKLLQAKSGPFSITPECKSYYEEWNQSNELVMKDRHPATRGWFESKGEMLFKLAMLTSLSNERGERLVIDVPHYKFAQYCCAMVENTLERVFEGTGINPSSQAAAQICRMLEALPHPMNEKIILGMFFDAVPDIHALQDTITHLVSVGRLAKHVVTMNGTTLGVLLGTPSSLANRTALELAGFLTQRVGRPVETSVDSSSTMNPSSPHDNPPTDSPQA